MSLRTPKFRGSFVHLSEPTRPHENADPVYSMVVVLPKDDTKTKQFMSDLKRAAEKALVSKFGAVPRPYKKAWKDGDEENRPEWEGCWVLQTKNKQRPGVVDRSMKPVPPGDDRLYSGAYYVVTVDPWCWSHPTGGKGVSLNLNNVLWFDDGEPFAFTPVEAEDDFKDLRDFG